mmetsp:Transcript_2217/g.6423  ORF Transcript_2217/g.6423 Transcript_2217/m.6423 type:complete len:295 (-) Transcript_2217:3031-3915(-)
MPQSSSTMEGTSRSLMPTSGSITMSISSTKSFPATEAHLSAMRYLRPRRSTREMMACSTESGMAMPLPSLPSLMLTTPFSTCSRPCSRSSLTSSRQKKGDPALLVPSSAAAFSERLRAPSWLRAMRTSSGGVMCPSVTCKAVGIFTICTMSGGRPRPDTVWQVITTAKPRGKRIWSSSSSASPGGSMESSTRLTTACRSFHDAESRCCASSMTSTVAARCAPSASMCTSMAVTISALTSSPRASVAVFWERLRPSTGFKRCAWSWYSSGSMRMSRARCASSAAAPLRRPSGRGS